MGIIGNKYEKFHRFGLGLGLRIGKHMASGGPVAEALEDETAAVYGNLPKKAAFPYKSLILGLISAMITELKEFILYKRGNIGGI
jgi:hypothetical protein